MSTQRLPNLLTVARLQVGLLVDTKYLPGLAGLVALAMLPPHVFGIFEEFQPVWARTPTASFAYAIMIPIGAIAGVITWFNEGPGNRRYHWGMPVRRELHDLIRILAGASWLLLLVAALCIVSWYAEDPLTRQHWLADAPLFWLGVFLVSLLAYLLATIPALLSARPFVWILGVCFAVLATATETVQRVAPPLANVGKAIGDEQSRASLSMALGGGLLSAEWSNPAARYRVFKAVPDEVGSAGAVNVPPREKLESILSTWPDAPGLQPRAWIEALAVWYGVALLGIALALRRRPDV